MAVLAEHGPQPTHLPHQPFHDAGAGPRFLRQEAPGLVGQIDQDRPGLEHRDRLAAIGRRAVHDGRNAVVRADRQKFRPELLAGADVDRNDLIGKPEFLQHDRDFPAVGRRRVVQVDHGFPWLPMREYSPRWRLLLFCTSIIRHGRQALNQNRPGGSHAVSNHDRRLLAQAGMAGRAEHALGPLEIERRRTRPRQARRHHAGGEAAGGCRRRYRHRGRAGPPAFRPRLSGEGRGHRFRPQGRDGHPERPLQGDGAAGDQHH